MDKNLFPTSLLEEVSEEVREIAFKGTNMTEEIMERLICFIWVKDSISEREKSFLITNESIAMRTNKFKKLMGYKFIERLDLSENEVESLVEFLISD